MESKEIIKLRKSLKMSQKAFGIKIGELLDIDRPIAPNTICRWETGKCIPHDTFMGVLIKLKNDKLKEK